jgi:hypothetical protein
MGLLVWLGLKNPKFVEKKKEPYKRKPKVTVFLKNGSRVIHYAGCRRIDKDGTLFLYSKWNSELGTYEEKDTVAVYAPGAWVSLSTGTRFAIRDKDENHS